MSKRVLLLWPLIGASLLLFSLLIAFGFTSVVRAAPDAVILEVDRLDDPALPTGSACTAAANDCTLRGAVSKASDGDTIVLAKAGAIVLSQGEIVLTETLTINSADAATHIIDGDHQHLIFKLDSNKQVILDGLTLQNGFHADASGGAVIMNAGALTITNSVLQNNVAGDKGGALGIVSFAGTTAAYIYNTNFVGNHALDDFLSGGAIHAAANDVTTINLIIEDVAFENNIGGIFTETVKDGYGGAIALSALDGGSHINFSIEASSFISNGSGYGGAIYLQSYARNSGASSVEGSIDSTTFVQNRGQYGAAIYNSSLDGGSQTALSISHASFMTNTSINEGGAYVQEVVNRGDNNATRGHTTIANSLFSGNTSGTQGGALYALTSAFDNSLDADAALELLNVTLSGNHAAQDGGALYSTAGGIDVTSSWITATHVTVFGNASGGQSSIKLDSSATAHNSLYLKSSIIGGDAGQGCNNFNGVIDGANNLIQDASCGSASPFRLDRPVALIHQLADNGGPTLTHGLYAQSNALNAVPAAQCREGNSAIPVIVDQRDLARPFGAGCDIGAFEAQSANLPDQPAVTGLTASNSGPSLVNTPITFTAEIAGGEEVSFTWDFGDGGSGAGITATHPYSLSGVYTATVVASNANNSVTATTKVYVGDAVVTVQSNFYNPAEVTIAKGGKVVWVLRGGSHSVTADDNSFEQLAGTNWSPFIHTFASAGTVTYHCSVHGFGMAGAVVVTGDGPPPQFDNGVLLPNIQRSGE